jgi:hypothetical protein
MIVGMFVASLDEKNVQWGKCCAMKTCVYLELMGHTYYIDSLENFVKS